MRALRRENPRDSQVLAELASVAEDEGRRAEARRLYDQALGLLRPSEPGAEYTVAGYACLLADEGQLGRARSIVKRWIPRLGRARKPHGLLDAWLARQRESGRGA